MAPQGGQPRGTVSLDVIGEAWQLLTANIGVWVLAIVITWGIGFALNFVSGLIRLPLTPPEGVRPSMAFIIVSLVLVILSTAVNFFLNAGLVRMAIQHVRTGTVDVGQIFGAGDVFGSIVLSSILVGICVVLGCFLLLIPGIIIGVLFSLTQQLIVDRKLSATQAMSKSWEGIKPHLGMMFVLLLILGLINLGGLLACCVGSLVTLPLMQISLVLVYRDLFGLNVPDYPGPGAMQPGAYPGAGNPGSGYQPPIPRP